MTQSIHHSNFRLTLDDEEMNQLYIQISISCLMCILLNAKLTK